jgi:hypothetical protein
MIRNGLCRCDDEFASTNALCLLSTILPNCVCASLAVHFKHQQEDDARPKVEVRVPVAAKYLCKEVFEGIVGRYQCIGSDGRFGLWTPARTTCNYGRPWVSNVPRQEQPDWCPKIQPLHFPRVCASTESAQHAWTVCRNKPSTQGALGTTLKQGQRNCSINEADCWHILDRGKYLTIRRRQEMTN